MSLTYIRVRETAEAIVSVSDSLASLLADIQRVLTFNSNQAIDWAAGSTPSYITEGADGNLIDKPFSRQDVANAIGSLDWLRKLLTNQSMTGSQGDHLGNINKLARAL